MPATWETLTDSERDEVRAIHTKGLQSEFGRTIKLALESNIPESEDLAQRFARFSEPEAMIDNDMSLVGVTPGVISSNLVPAGLADKALILTVPTFESTANAHFLASRRPLIQISYGMCTAGYFAAAVFFEYLYATSSEERGNAIAAAISVAKSIADEDIFYLDVVWELIPRPSRHRDIIGMLSMTTTAFLLAHEFAHHVYRHSESRTRETTKQQELEADAFAFDLCTSIVGSETVLHAMGLHFLIMHLTDFLDGIPSGSVYPSSKERWTAIREKADDASSEIGSNLEVLMQEVIASAKEMEPYVFRLRGAFPFRD